MARRRIVLTEDEALALFKRAVREEVADVLRSARTGIPSRTGKEDQWRDDESLDRTGTATDGGSSSEPKTEPPLWSRLEAKLQRKQNEGTSKERSKNTKG